MSASILSIPIWLWLRLVADLKRRGAGVRESGAFLLGRQTDERRQVRTYVCYDDLDPDALSTGIVTISGNGYSALWAHCRRRKLRVLADVHTHGNAHPEQSGTDEANPMIPEAGHVALILPSYAHGGSWRLQNVAVYEYKGNYHWDRHPRSHIHLTIF